MFCALAAYLVVSPAAGQLRNKQAADLYFVRHGQYPPWYSPPKSASAAKSAAPNPSRSAPSRTIAHPGNPKDNLKKAADRFFIYNGYYPSWYNEGMNQDNSKIATDPFFDRRPLDYSTGGNQGPPKIAYDPFFTPKDGYKLPEYSTNQQDHTSTKITEDPFFNDDNRNKSPHPLRYTAANYQEKLKVSEDPFFQRHNKGYQQSNSGYSGSINPFYEENHQVPYRTAAGGPAKKEKTKIVEDPFFTSNKDYNQEGQASFSVGTPYQRRPISSKITAASSYSRPEKTKISDDPLFQSQNDNYENYQSPKYRSNNQQDEKTKIADDPFFTSSQGYEITGHSSGDAYYYQRRPIPSKITSSAASSSSYKPEKTKIADDPFFNDYHPLGYFSSSSKPNNYPPIKFPRKQVPSRASAGKIASDPFFRNNAAVNRQRPQQKSVDKFVIVVQ